MFNFLRRGLKRKAANKNTDQTKGQDDKDCDQKYKTNPYKSVLFGNTVNSYHYAVSNIQTDNSVHENTTLTQMNREVENCYDETGHAMVDSKTMTQEIHQYHRLELFQFKTTEGEYDSTKETGNILPELPHYAKVTAKKS